MLKDTSKSIRASVMSFVLVMYSLLSLSGLFMLRPDVVSADGECTQPGYFPSTTSLITNGNFTQTASDVLPTSNPIGYDNTTPGHYYAYSGGGFYSQVANVGDDTYPHDISPQRNQFSIQTGVFVGADEGANPSFGLNQQEFPGDPTYGIPATSTWWYSNGNALNGGEYLTWEQDITTGLEVGKEYVFVAYISNVIEPPAAAADDPTMTLKIGGTTGLPDGTVVLGTDVLTEAETANSEPLNGWQRVAFSFTATSASEKLKITDSSGGINGDDFALTAITLQKCEPLFVPVRKPYFRTYGNDIIAGGGYGETCTVDGDEFAFGYGTYKTASQDHSSYAGSASELAVFAAGQIAGVLPGAQKTTPRSAMWELSFANNNPTYNSTSDLLFGGGFNEAICADDLPDPTGWTVLSGSTVSLNGLASGDYLVEGSSVQITGTSIPNGRRIRLFVRDPSDSNSGDAVIMSNIGYQNSSWASLDDIPLLRIYADGDIKVDHAVSQLTGLYSAQNHIYTCTDANRILLPSETPPPGQGGSDELAAQCNSKLTVFGALIAQRVNFWRTRGDIEDASATPGDAYTSPNIAESIVFSPELYLALLTEGGFAIDPGNIDSIRTLPPAL